MTTFAYKIAPRPMTLRLSTAAELMTPRPLAFDESTPIEKAAAMLRLHELAAAPMVDSSGRPVGVITTTACAAWEEFSQRSSPSGPEGIRGDGTPVAEIANPKIDLVSKDASAREVIDALVARRARRAYVVDAAGALVGVVSMADVLRHLANGDAMRSPRSGAAHLC